MPTGIALGTKDSGFRVSLIHPLKFVKAVGFFFYSLLACDLSISWRDYVLSVSCPLSARWRHVASSPLPCLGLSLEDVVRTEEITKEKRGEKTNETA